MAGPTQSITDRQVASRREDGLPAGLPMIRDGIIDIHNDNGGEAHMLLPFLPLPLDNTH